MSEFSNENAKQELAVNQVFLEDRRKEVEQAWKNFLETGDDSYWFWDIPQDHESEQLDSEMEL